MLPLFYHVTFSLVTPIYRAWLILTPSTVQSVDRPLIALPTQLVVSGGLPALRTARAKLDDERGATHQNFAFTPLCSIQNSTGRAESGIRSSLDCHARNAS
jgi:hypothetical protein